MSRWTIHETELLNVNVSSTLEVIDSEVQCCIYKGKKNLSALSHFNKMWNLKHSDIILLILVAEA